MKRGLNLTLTLCTVIILVGCGRYVYVSGNTDIERQSPIPEITTEEVTTTEPATETAESICSSEQDTTDSLIVESSAAEPVAADETEPDIYSMDVYELGEYLYGIPDWNITRALRLLSIEGYDADYLLDYYCACTIVNRLIQDPYCSDIYASWGGLDYWYCVGNCDGYGIDGHAYTALRDALIDPADVWGCNGMDEPSEYVYYSGGIYVW